MEPPRIPVPKLPGSDRAAAPVATAAPLEATASAEAAAPLEAAAPVVLVFGADEHFALPMAAALHSALVHLPRAHPVTVYVLDGGLADGSRERLRRTARRAHAAATLSFLVPDEALLESVFQRMELNGKKEARFSRAVLLRLLIPELIPAHHPRAIYLDSDLVVEADLFPLWQADLRGKPLAAVQDLYIPHVSCRLGVHNWQALGLAAEAPYFNSGLLVLDLAAWRAERIGRRVLDYLTRHGDTLNFANDQEGMNAVLADAWTPLDPRWNVIHLPYHRRRYAASDFRAATGVPREALVRSPHVIHFTSRKKPWHRDCTHPRRRRFFHHVRRSGWFSARAYLRWRVPLYGAQGIAAAALQTREFVRAVRKRIRARRPHRRPADPA